jgi:hypothetical protein
VADGYDRRVDELGVARRRLGGALLGFGLVGVILAGLLAIGLIAGAILARNLDERVRTDQARLAASLERVTVTIGRLATTTTNGGATLESSSVAILGARDVTEELRAVTVDLADSLEVSILGSRPFTAVAQRFRELSSRVEVFRGNLDTLAGRLGTNASNVAEMAVDVRRIEVEVRELSGRVSQSQGLADVVGVALIGLLLGGVLVAWLAVGAALCAWAGWRLRRPARRSDG